MHRFQGQRSAYARTILVLSLTMAAGGAVYYFGLRSDPTRFDIALNNTGPQLTEAKAAPGDWPWWRGPTLDGHSPDADAPLKWDEKTNVLWKAPIPGSGFSSPIVIGNQVVLTSAEENPPRQFVIAVDRQTGKKLWETTAHTGGLMPKHGQNTHASATCAFDGERIFASFVNSDALRITALNQKGDILWQKEAGTHGGRGSHGGGPSPVLAGSYLIVSDDSPAGGFIAALHRATGEIAWRKTRSVGEGSYGTPTIAELGGKKLVLLAGGKNLSAYDPQTGNLEWVCPGIANTSANTVTVGGDLAFAGSGNPQRILMAVRPDGSIAWKYERDSELPYPPSMLWDNGYLYLVSDKGRATCLDAQTGKSKWSEAIKGPIWGSPILVGKRIYVPDRNGVTFVFEASPEGCNELARNKLDGSISSSPAAVGGSLYIRTDTHLYRLGK